MRGTTLSLFIIVGLLAPCLGQGICPSMRIAKRVALEPPGEPSLARIRFGTDVSIVGNFLVVGAPGHTANTGAAYTFQRAGGVWTFKQRLGSPKASSQHEFGHSVSISRAYTIPVVAVGAPNATNDQGLRSGSVQVFEMKGGRFAWTQTLTPPGAAAQPGAQFGYSVDADGFMIAVGSPRHDRKLGASTLVDSGAVFVYSKATTTSRYVLTDTLYGEQREQMFGKNVRVKGVFPFTGPRVLLVGAPNSAPNGFGAAYLYRWNGKSWYFKQRLVPSEASIGIQSKKAGSEYGTGISLTTDPEVAMVGGVYASGPGSPTSGAAYMWNLLNEQYRQSTDGLYPDGGRNARFGESIMRVRDTVMIGSPGFTAQSNQGLPVPEEGTAYTFVKCTDNSFNKTGMIRLPNRQRLANLGSVVEMDDRMLFVGAPGYNSGSDPKGKPGRGALFVYPFRVIPVESELHYQGDPPNVIKNCPGKEFPCPHTLYSALQEVKIGCLLLRGETPISNTAQTAPVNAGNGRVPSYAVPGKIRVPNNLTNGETVDLRLVQLDPATGREVKKTKAPLRVVPCNFNTNPRVFQRAYGI
mmetsp:Transcript_39110/g.154985  ORF Transcript_39110/g.154985 Transcript_39110/m.154985 type:complete len:580 (-) Transcript_39110:4228-5967(-)